MTQAGQEEMKGSPEGGLGGPSEKPSASQRSLLSTIRNPLLALPETLALIAFLQEHPDLQEKFAAHVAAIGKACRVKAQVSWKQNKGPMASYWKVSGTYAGHTHRAIRAKPVVTAQETLRRATPEQMAGFADTLATALLYQGAST